MQSTYDPVFTRMLLATDFSVASGAAFRAALQLCHLYGATLHILNVFEYSSIPPPECGGQMLELDSFYQDAQASLSSLIHDARRDGIRCDGDLLSGTAHSAVIDEIKRCDADLVILGTRSIRGFERLVFGSTAEAVLRKASCPVFTVGPRAKSRDLGMEPDDGIVLFATDFHAATTEALAYAVSFAALSHLSVHCLHVLPRGLEDGSHQGVVPLIITEALQHLLSTHDADQPLPVCAVTYGSEVSGAVLEYSREHHAKLIVLGVRRASLAASHIPAHIAYRVIAEAPCPVLTMAYPLEGDFSKNDARQTQGSSHLPFLTVQ